MIRVLLACSMLVPVGALAQTKPSISQGCYLGALSIVCKEDVANAIAPKADSTRLDSEITRAKGIEGGKADKQPLAAYLSSGQSVAQVQSGQVDAAPAINAMFAGQNGGLLPCGTYRLDTPLVASSGSPVLRGFGRGCVTLNVNFASGDIVSLVGNGTAQGVSRPRLSDLTFNAAINRTSGAIIHASGTYDAQFDRVAFTGHHAADGFLVDGAASTTRISSLDCRPPVDNPGGGVWGAGACIHGAGDFADLFIDHANSYSWQYGLQLTQGSGFIAHNTDFIQSRIGILFDPAAGQIVWGVHMTDVQSDSSLYDNVAFQGSGYITDVQLTALWASNSQRGHGISMNNPNINGVQFIGPNVLYNWLHGMILVAGRNIIISGPRSSDNSKVGSGAYHGIAVAGAGPSTLDNITIEGGQMGHAGIAVARGDIAQQGYGVIVEPIGSVVGATETRHLTIINNQATGNVTGGFSLTSGAYTVTGGNSQ